MRKERKKAVNEAKDAEIGGMAMEIASRWVEREIRKPTTRMIDEFTQTWVKHRDRDSRMCGGSCMTWRGGRAGDHILGLKLGRAVL